jgi:hypothetical protein
VSRNWSTADVSAVYKRNGSPSPIKDACGSGSKYHAQKTIVDGIKFDSAAESRAYSKLRWAELLGIISDLELQPRYVLQEGFSASGKRVRAITYRGDFRFIREGKTVVVEVKGFETEAWKIREKLFRAKYPDIVLEVWK